MRRLCGRVRGAGIVREGQRRAQVVCPVPLALQQIRMHPCLHATRPPSHPLSTSPHPYLRRARWSASPPAPLATVRFESASIRMCSCRRGPCRRRPLTHPAQIARTAWRSVRSTMMSWIRPRTTTTVRSGWTRAPWHSDAEPEGYDDKCQRAQRTKCVPDARRKAASSTGWLGMVARIATGGASAHRAYAYRGSGSRRRRKTRR